MRLIASGHLPLWDSGPGFGQPYLANPEPQVLYPTTWLNLLLRPWACYTVFVTLHAWLSACGMAALARRRGLSWFASFAAAALWILSGPFVSLFDLWHHCAGAAWIPWVVLAADRAFERRARWDFFVLGTAFGMQLLAASADMVVMTAVFVGADLVALRLRWTRATGRENARLLLGLSGAVVVAIALSAGQWFASIDAALGSDRFGLSESIRTFWSVHPWALLETLYAGIWAAVPLDAAHRAAVFESREPFLRSIYFGAGLVALAATPLVARPRDRRVVLVLAVAAAALLVALGRHAPFYRLAVDLLPVLRVLRYPVKALVLVAFCVTLAAGHGVDDWHRGRVSGRGRRVILGFVALIATAALVGAIATHGAQALVVAAVVSGVASLLLLWRSPWAAIAVALLAILDLGRVHAHVHATAPRGLYAYRPEVVDYIRTQPDARAYVYDYGTQITGYTPPPDTAHHLQSAPNGWGLEAAEALARQMSLSPATAGRWGLETGYDMDLRGLYPHALAQLPLLLRHSEGTPLHLRLLRMGGITHVVALHESGFRDLRPVARFAGLYDQPVRVFAVPDTLPRTYAVGTAHAASDIEAFHRLAAPDFDPTREVLVAEAGPYETREGEVGTSRVVGREPDRVRLEAEMTVPGYVVLLDHLSRGWSVRVDGQPAKALRANLAFRAVAVAAGRHTIEWIYRPTAALIGLALSAISAVLVAGAFALRTRQRQQSSSHD